MQPWEGKLKRKRKGEGRRDGERGGRKRTTRAVPQSAGARRVFRPKGLCPLSLFSRKGQKIPQVSLKGGARLYKNKGESQKAKKRDGIRKG